MPCSRLSPMTQPPPWICRTAGRRSPGVRLGGQVDVEAQDLARPPGRTRGSCSLRTPLRRMRNGSRTWLHGHPGRRADGEQVAEGLLHLLGGLEALDHEDEQADPRHERDPQGHPADTGLERAEQDEQRPWRRPARTGGGPPARSSARRRRSSGRTASGCFLTGRKAFTVNSRPTQRGHQEQPRHGRQSGVTPAESGSSTACVPPLRTLRVPGDGPSPSSPACSLDLRCGRRRAATTDRPRRPSAARAPATSPLPDAAADPTTTTARPDATVRGRPRLRRRPADTGASTDRADRHEA